MEYIKELEHQRNELDQKIKELKDDNLRDKIIEKQKYVGKCYKIEDKNSTTYFKVLSELAESKNEVSCVYFELPFKVGFNEVWDNYCVRYGDYFYDFDHDNFIDFLSIQPNEFITKNEISVEDFEAAMREYIEQVIVETRKDFTMNAKWFHKRQKV